MTYPGLFEDHADKHHEYMVTALMAARIVLRRLSTLDKDPAATAAVEMIDEALKGVDIR